MLSVNAFREVNTLRDNSSEKPQLDTLIESAALTGDANNRLCRKGDDAASTHGSKHGVSHDGLHNAPEMGDCKPPQHAVPLVSIIVPIQRD
jgi:hypothetical protein